MLREGVRLSRRHQWLTFATGAALFLTGAMWILLDRFARVPGEFGATPHPTQVWWLRAHGAAAMMFLLVLGSLVRGHMRVGWRMRQNRLSGASLAGANVLLIMTGWGLYYVGVDVVRDAAVLAHCLVGLLAAPLLVLHVVAGRSGRRSRSPDHRTPKVHRANS